jgi:hypothetical protein
MNVLSVVAVTLAGFCAAVVGTWATLKFIEWKLGWSRAYTEQDLIASRAMLDAALREEDGNFDCVWLVRGFKAAGDRVIPDEPIEGTVVGYEIDPELGLGTFHVHRAKEIKS